MKPDLPSLGLRIVGPAGLPEPHRAFLRPGEAVRDEHGIARHLPSHFYEIPSWEAALRTRLTAHFGLWELIDVDVREPLPMRTFPRYVPCAITLLAGQLQLFRDAVGRVVRIAANGGYRSPAHEFSRTATPHAWAVAANIYRVGDEWLDNRDRVEKYREIARSALAGAWVRPYGDLPGCTFDHLHVDLGFVLVEPPAGSSSDDGRDG
jgi:hypothetical protein